MIEQIIFVIIGITFLFLMLVIQLYGATWLRGFISGARVTFLELISLSLRKVPVRKTVAVRITLIKAGVNDLIFHSRTTGTFHLQISIYWLIPNEEDTVHKDL